MCRAEMLAVGLGTGLDVIAQVALRRLRSRRLDAILFA